MSKAFQAYFALFAVLLGTSSSYVPEIAEKKGDELLRNCSVNSIESYSPTCPDGKVKLPDGNKECSPIKVNILLQLEKFYDINDVEETFEFSGCVRFDWSVLCPDYYQKDEVIFYPNEETFWRTRINHINAAHNIGLSGSSFTSRFFVHVFNHSTARFSLQRFGVFTSNCELDFTYFPFDEQNCSIDFQMQTLMQAGRFDVVNVQFFEDLIPLGNTWSLMNSSYNVSSIDIDGLRSYVSIYFSFSRNPAFHFFSLMLPCCLLTSIELPCLLFLESKSVDKPMMAATIMLALTFLQGQILERVPVKPKRMFISNYTDLCVLESMLCTIYCLFSCYMARSKRKWSDHAICGMAFKTTRIRCIDVFVFTIALTCFLTINIYAWVIVDFKKLCTPSAS